MTFENPIEKRYVLDPALIEPGERSFIEVEPMVSQGPITSYPSDEKMSRLYDALDRVLDSYNQEPGLRQAYREELLRRIELAPLGIDIRETVGSISLEDVRKSLL